MLSPIHDMEFILLLLLSRLLGSESVKKVVAILQGLRKGGVLRLKKAVYGLKQAPREWWKMLHAFLLSLGFRPNRADVCLYTLHLPGELFVSLLLYVDDILIAASTPELVNYYSKRISETFRVSAEGPLTNYLGFDIIVDLANHRVSIGMSRYVEKMFERLKWL